MLQEAIRHHADKSHATEVLPAPTSMDLHCVCYLTPDGNDVKAVDSTSLPYIGM